MGILPTILTFLTTTLLPAIIGWLLTDVLLVFARSVIKDLLIDVILNGGFITYDGLATYLSTIAGPAGSTETGISETIYILAFVTVAINVIISGIKMVMAPTLGKQSESPMAFFARCMITAILLIFYPKLVSLVVNFLNGIAEMPMFQLDANAINEIDIWMNPLKDGVGYTLLYIVLTTMILKDVVFAIFIYVERYFSFALYMLLGPVVIAMYPNENQKGMVAEWFKQILTQMLVILISLFCFNLFCRYLTTSNWTEIYSITTENVAEVFIGSGELLRAIVAVALIELVKNSEQIVNALGLRTIPSGDSARSFVQGVIATAPSISRRGNNLINASRKSYEAGIAATKARRGDALAKQKFVSSLDSKKLSMQGVKTNDSDATKIGNSVMGNELDRLAAINKGYLTENDYEKAKKNVMKALETNPNAVGFGNNTRLENFVGRKSKDMKDAEIGMDKAIQTYKSSQLAMAKAKVGDKNITSQDVLMSQGIRDKVGVGNAQRLVGVSYDKYGNVTACTDDTQPHWERTAYQMKKPGQDDKDAKTYVAMRYGYVEGEGKNAHFVKADCPIHDGFKKAQNAPLTTDAEQFNNVASQTTDIFRKAYEDTISGNPEYAKFDNVFLNSDSTITAKENFQKDYSNKVREATSDFNVDGITPDKLYSSLNVADTIKTDFGAVTSYAPTFTNDEQTLKEMYKENPKFDWQSQSFGKSDDGGYSVKTEYGTASSASTTVDGNGITKFSISTKDTYGSHNGYMQTSDLEVANSNIQRIEDAKAAEAAEKAASKANSKSKVTKTETVVEQVSEVQMQTPVQSEPASTPIPVQQQTTESAPVVQQAPEPVQSTAPIAKPTQSSVQYTSPSKEVSNGEPSSTILDEMAEKSENPQGSNDSNNSGESQPQQQRPKKSKNWHNNNKKKKR